MLWKTPWKPDRGKKRMDAHAVALRMLSDLLKDTDMRLGQIMHALAFEDGIKKDIFHISDEDMADKLTRLRVAMLGEVTDDEDLESA